MENTIINSSELRQHIKDKEKWVLDPLDIQEVNDLLIHLFKTEWETHPRLKRNAIKLFDSYNKSPRHFVYYEPIKSRWCDSKKKSLAKEIDDLIKKSGYRFESDPAGNLWLYIDE